MPRIFHQWRICSNQIERIFAAWDPSATLVLALALFNPLFPLSAAPPDAGWAQVWGDEFDGTAITTNQYGLDTNKWSSTLPWNNNGTNRWNSVNDAYWIADQCTYVTNGSLVIVNQNSPPTSFPGHSAFHYESGWAQSRYKMAYTWGYAEIRAQYPNGTAMWPTWWMLGANGNWPPEVDVAERYPNGTLNHGMYYAGAGGTGTWTSGGQYANDPIYAMNTYGFEWNPGYTAWSKNGSVLVSFASQYVPSQPVYMILSGGVVTNGSNGGSLASQTFPAYFTIDYVRLFKRAEYIYNGDFSATNNQSGSIVGDWIVSNVSAKSGAGLNGNNALLLSTGASPSGASQAQQAVYGLVPHTSYLISGNLQSANGSPVYLGVTGSGGGVMEQTTTNTSSYVPLVVNFATGNTNTAAIVYGRLDSGSGHSGFLDELTLRRTAAVADSGFETGILSTYWHDGSYGSYSIDFANQRSGRRCLALGAALSAGQQIIQGLNSNTTYQLSGWAKANGNTVYLGVKDFGGIETNMPVNTATSYGKAAVTFTTGATNTTALVYAYNPTYNGIPIYVDDFFLSEPLAANWQRTDIGSVILAGDSGQRGNQFVLRGSGADVGGAADAFHFVYQTLTGDGRITARVLKVDPTDPNAKAGIMLRDGTNASAACVALDWLANGHVEFIMRTNTLRVTGSQWISNTVPIAPILRLERLGDTFTTSWSADGINWNIVATVSSANSQSLNAGLFVNSHNTAQINEGVFEGVSVVPYGVNLTASLVNGNVQLSWPISASAYQLYSTASLQNPVWTAVTNSPSDTNGLLLLTMPVKLSNQFFRLQSQ
jgi:beta-glucanase (GH16 family)